MELINHIKNLHKGDLTVDKVGKGMHLCYVNACNLIEDAEILLKKSPGRSISLSILALEEISKIYILLNAAALYKKMTWEEFEKSMKLKSHQIKLYSTLGYGKILEKIGKGYSKNIPAEMAPFLDKFKQLGFYVNFVSGDFCSPKKFGQQNKQWAKYIITVAKERVNRLKKMHGTEKKSKIIAEQASKIAKLAKKAGNKEEFTSFFQEWLKNYHK